MSQPSAETINQIPNPIHQLKQEAFSLINFDLSNALLSRDKLVLRDVIGKIGENVRGLFYVAGQTANEQLIRRFVAVSDHAYYGNEESVDVYNELFSQLDEVISGVDPEQQAANYELFIETREKHPILDVTEESVNNYSIDELVAIAKNALPWTMLKTAAMPLPMNIKFTTIAHELRGPL